MRWSTTRWGGRAQVCRENVFVLGQEFGSVVAVGMFGRVGKGLGGVHREGANKRNAAATFPDVAPEFRQASGRCARLMMEDNTATSAVSGEAQGVGAPADVWVEATEPGLAKNEVVSGQVHEVELSLEK